jgi:hypothetical protein
MAANTTFELVNRRGWSRGFHNLLRNEMNAWWGTRT